MLTNPEIRLFMKAMSSSYRHFSAIGHSQFLLGTHEFPEGVKSWVYFQPSEDREDWHDDMKFAKVRHSLFANGKVSVHRGFYDQFLSLDEIGVIGERDYYLGHSLGGALALLFALKYGSRDTRVIASGCPRVGNAAFVEAIADSGRITRIINNSDPVTHLPPYWLGYRHPDSEVVRVSDQPRNFWSYVLGDFKAHWPARYIKALANL